MAVHNDLGKKGEQLAVKYLIDKGFEILETNWRYQKDELDIIAKFNDLLIICEVKTRSSNHFGQPEEFVDVSKQKRIIKATNSYIEQHHFDLETRFDVISILITEKNYQIKHIESAFSVLG